jgi:hypothetical protein
VKKNRNRTRSDCKRRLWLEPLENRTLLSVQLQLNGPQMPVPNNNINMTLVNNMPGTNNGGNPGSETAMAVDPTNPLNVVGFTHDFTAIAMQLFFSVDGGQTWRHRTIDNSFDSINNATIRTDPTLNFDANGTLYLAYGVKDPNQTTLFSAHGRFQNGTLSLSGPVFVDRADNTDSKAGLDKWELATGLDPSTGGQAVYLAYTHFFEIDLVIGAIPQNEILVTGSHDGGNTWLNHISIHTVKSDQSFACPAVGPNGELYVTWEEWNELPLSPSGPGSIHFARNLQGLWAGGDQLEETEDIQGFQNKVFETKVPPQPNRGINNGPVLAVDDSHGPFRGRLYVVWVDTVNGGNTPTDIFLEFSDHHGDEGSWTPMGSSGQVVDGGTGNDFLPWLDVDPASGGVNVMFYSNNKTASSNLADVILATSSDGGANFSTAALTTTPSNAGSVGSKGNDFGDYTGLAVLDGTAHGFWADTRTGNMTPFTTTASFQSLTGNNTLVVRGDDPQANFIQIFVDPTNASFLDVSVNGTLEYSGLIATMNNISVDGALDDQNVGTNTVDVEGIPSNIAVTVTNAQTVVLGDLTNGLRQVLGSFTLVPWSGLTALTVDDSADTLAHANVNVTPSNIAGLALGSINFPASTLSSLAIELGTGGNTVNVQGMSVPLTISSANPAANQDTINIGAGDPSNNIPGGNLDTVKGLVTIQGNPTVTSVNLLDQNAAFAGIYSVTNQNVARSFLMNNDHPFGGSTPFGGLDYSGLKSLTLNAEAGSNTVNVTSTAVETDNTINAGSGLQTVDIGLGNSNGLDDIASPVRVNGNDMGSTVDHTITFTTVIVDDSGNPNITTYGIDASTVTRGMTMILTYSSVTDLELDGSGGLGGANLDTINIESTSATDETSIKAAANNTINVSPATHNLDGIGHLSITAGGGSASLNIDDQGTVGSFVSPGNTTYTVDQNTLTRNATYINFTEPQIIEISRIATVDYANVFPTLYAGPRRNAINVLGISWDTSIHAGPAGDMITVGPSLDRLGVLFPFGVNSFAAAGTLTVDARGGTIKLDDHATQDIPLDPRPEPGTSSTGLTYGPILYTVTAGEVDRMTHSTETTVTARGPDDPPGPPFATMTQRFSYTAMIHYSNASSLEIDSSPINAGSSFDIQSTAAETPVTVKSGSAQDRYTATLSALNAFLGLSLPTLQGDLIINGQGSNSLIINDQADTWPFDYTITSSTISHPTNGTITYTNLKSVALNGGIGVVNYNVQGTAANTPITIKAAGGVATVNLGTGNLDSLAGSVTIDGSTSITIVNLNDQSASATERYVLYASSFSRPNFGGLTFSDIASLTVDMTAGNALGNYRSSANIFVLATPATMTTIIQAPNGADNITIGLPIDPTINTTGLPGSSLENIQGPVTVNGDYYDNMTLWDWDSTTAQKAYTITSSSISAAVVGGATSGLISWQGYLSTAVLFGSAAADTYQFQSLPTTVAALVVDGYYRANTFQSLLPDRHTWFIYSNQTITTAAATGHSAIFGEVWNFTGGPAGDDFQFVPNYGQDGVLSGVLNGNGGTLDYSQDSSPITVNLANNSTTNLNGGAANGFMNIQSVIGNGTSTTLVGPDIPNYWTIIGNNQGNLSATPNQPGSFTFSQVPNLTGGAVADTFRFQNGSSLTGFLNGADGLNGGGNNTLDLSAYTTPLNVHISSSPYGGTVAGVVHAFALCQNVIGGQGNDSFVVDQGYGLTTLDGGPGNNTLDLSGYSFGPQNVAITGPNSGYVAGEFGSFANIQNIVTGSTNDTFAFRAGGNLGGSIDGGGGTNTLNYSQYQGDVTINLRLGTATAVAGGINHIQNVTGSIGNDLIVGDANPHVFIGGTGRNLIIGGAGPDTITGGGGDSILIGGTTIWDTNTTALQAIMQEWTDTSLTFDTRVNALRRGIIVNNVTYALNRNTVLADNSPDSLIGGKGQNWFFFDFDDIINNGAGPGVNDRVNRV